MTDDEGTAMSGYSETTNEAMVPCPGFEVTVGKDKCGWYVEVLGPPNHQGARMRAKREWQEAIGLGDALILAARKVAAMEQGQR